MNKIHPKELEKRVIEKQLIHKEWIKFIREQKEEAPKINLDLLPKEKKKRRLNSNSRITNTHLLGRRGAQAARRSLVATRGGEGGGRGRGRGRGRGQTANSTANTRRSTTSTTSTSNRVRSKRGYKRKRPGA